MKNKWIFVPSKSDGLTGEETVTIPHMVMMVRNNFTPTLSF